MKISILFLAILYSLAFFKVHAQTEVKKSETIQVKTSAICNTCKHTIETALYNLKGVKTVDLDLKTKIVTVTYKTTLVTPDQLRKAISMAGYDADDVKADPAAYDKLHSCCKKEGE